MLTILISDDEPCNVSSLARIARRKGYRVIADEVSDVVALAANEHPDVILLDLLQRVYGGELLRRLKVDAATRDVPVWVMSGYVNREIEESCARLGAERFLVKPFDAMVEFDRLPGRPAVADGRAAAYRDSLTLPVGG